MNPPVISAGSRDELVRDCAQTLVDIFADYNTEFRAVTRRARRRFEDRDWHGSQRDAVERIGLYSRYVTNTVATMQKRLGEEAQEGVALRGQQGGHVQHRPIVAQPARARRARPCRSSRR